LKYIFEGWNNNTLTSTINSSAYDSRMLGEKDNKSFENVAMLITPEEN